MKHIALPVTLIITLLLGINSLNAQTQFWSDNFEDSGAPSSGTRTPSTTFEEPSVPYTRYFDRFDVSSINLQNGTYSNMQGSKFWAGEDLDNRGGSNNVVSANQFVTWSSINISGKTSISFKGLFAANNVGGSVWEGSSFGPSQDYVAVEYKIDGGAWTKGIGFYSNNVVNGSLSLDTDGDLIGDGTLLSYVFTEFSFNIAGTGTTMDIRLNCFANGTSTEEFAIDDFRLFSTPTCTAPTVTGNPPNRSICVNNNTTFSITATGATAYQWQVNTGSGFGDITNGGVYSNATTNTLTITGATAGMNGYLYRCVAINGVSTCSTNSNAGTLTVSNISTASGAQTNISCNGGNNGAAAVSPSGGISPYTYSWSPSGGTASIATGLSANVYTVSVTDNIGCTASRSFTLTQPPALSLTASSQTNIACNGGSNGAASVNTATGGTPGYTYDWSPGNPTGDGTRSVTGLTAGIWTCTVTDANACTASRSFTVTQPPAISLTPSSQTNISCFGGSNGAATVNAATGGAGGYTYDWIPGTPTGDGTTAVTGLTAGTWTCTVGDANACTASVNFTVTQPPAISLTPSSQTNISCFGGSNGAAAVNAATGGAGGYTYNWTPGNPTGDGTASVTGLSAGTWTCQVTDANSCIASVNFTVTQPTAISLTASSQTNISCFGGSNGAAAVNAATGGAGGYTYNWTPGNPTGDGTVSVTGLTAGTWTCQVTDANACTASRSFTVTQPPAISLTAASQTNVTCNGGSNGAAAVNAATGGAGGYTYNWTPGNPTGDGTVSVTGLSAGTWTCNVTDANACVASVNFTVTQPTAISLTASSQTNISCFGGSNGAAAVNAATGGAGGYTYNWTPGNPTGDGTVSVTGLSAGTWTCNVTDANACVASVNFTVTQPTAISLTAASQTNISCFGGSNGAAAVNAATGGAGGYTYNWTPGNPTGDGTVSVTGLTAGTWTCNVTDANACTASRSFTVTQPPAISLTAASQTNVACNGGSNGAAAVNAATGGAGGYTYNWTPGNPTGDGTVSVTGLTAGTWTCNVTDANACVASVNFTVTQPTAISLTPSSQTNVACNGGSNGAAAVNAATGGAGGYTYNWTPGNPTGDGTVSVTGLTAGTWTCNVTDANACVASVNFTVTQPTAISLTPSSQTNISCFGGSNGAAVVNAATGGAGGYTYNWTPGNPTGDGTVSVTGLSAGTWTCNVTDANACVASVNFTVTQPTAISATTSATDATCGSIDNGAIDLSVTGGQSGYTYTWNNTATTQDLTGLSAGNYSVTISDANGCSITASATVSAPAAITATPDSLPANTCYGDSTAGFYITTSGGVAPYTYLWTTGDTTEDISGLGAGYYGVTITDAVGCNLVFDSIPTQGPIEPLVLTLDSVQQNLCAGYASGAIYTTVTGGVSPYNYIWTNSNTNEDINGLGQGAYTLTVTDNNGCTVAPVSATLTDPAPISLSVTQVTDVSCNGGSNGAIDLSVSGGTGAYTYAWDNSNNTEDISGLSFGTYTVTVTDANGCSATTSALVNEPTPLTASTTGTNLMCNGASTGAVNLSVIGGTASYTYLWSNSETTEDITGVMAGTYTVTVTDANACSATSSVTLTQPTAIVVSSTITPVSCNAGNNGAIDITVSGGSPSYSYVWSNTAITQDISSLTAGIYKVTITDMNACTTVVSDTVTEPNAYSETVDSIGGILCNGGNTGYIYLTITGQTPPYAYVWSNGAITEDLVGALAGQYTLTVTDANNCSFATPSLNITEPDAIAPSITATNVSCNGNSDGALDLTVTGGTTPYAYSWSNSSTTEDISGLIAGSYTVTVTDGNGCSASASLTVTEPAVLSASIAATAVLCNGDNNGSLDLTVTGGTAAYSYSWSNSASTEDISNLTAGTYSVSVSDNNGCTTTASGTVNQPTVLTATTGAITNVSCNGGSNGAINIDVAGGTSTYTYAWSNGAITEDISGLVAGTYTETVTDANGCSVTVSATVTEPAALLLSTSVSDVSCNGGNNGEVDLTVTGGTTPYTYAWSNSLTTEDITNLTANTYTVTVTDANSCSATGSVLVGEPNALSTTITPANVSCNGGSNGSVDLLVTGGTNPYTYLWSNSEISEDLSNVTAGVYSVTITDNNGCSTTSTTTVTEPTAIVASVTVSNVNCNGGADGAVDLTVSGGTAGYTYLWNNTVTTEDISGLIAGTYTVTVTDANSCTATATATVTEPTALTASTTTTAVTCNTGSNGTIDLTVTGGTTAYTYVWSNTASTQDISGLSAGTYDVTVTDAHGCSITATETVVEPTAITATSGVTDVLCHGGNNGAIDMTVTGGAPGNYNYAWDNSATTEDITGLTAGNYNVTITDDNGCTATYGPVTVVEPDTIVGTLDSLFNVSCFGNSTGAIYVSVMGGVSPYAYQWSNGAITEDLVGVPAGIYMGTVTDANGCSIVSPAIPVTEPLAALNAVSDSVTDNLCFGGNTGAIYTTTAGGTSPYTYLWDNTETTDDITGLTAGLYTLTVTDANGCTVVLSETTGEPQQLIAATAAANISCYGLTDGSIDLTVTGGISPYIFAWDNSAATEDITGLAAGTYLVTVTDLNGCTVTAADSITEPTAEVVSASVTDVNCESGSDGAIDLTVSGGTPGYVFTWNTGDTTEDLTGLMIGVYGSTITDANGCAVTISDTVGFIHTDPILTLGADTTQCGGSITLDAQHAGNGTYVWNDNSTGQTLIASVSGSYNVVLTDTNGCTGTDTIDVTINDVPVITFDIVSDTLCLNASAITLTASPAGGTFAGTGVTGTSFNPTTAGSGLHTVTYSFTDNNGCSATAADSVLVDPCLGIETINTLSSIRMYPNPNNGSFVITAVGTADVECSLANDLGQVVKEFELTSSNNYTYGLTNIESGAYFVICRQGNATFTQKVIVIK